MLSTLGNKHKLKISAHTEEPTHNSEGTKGRLYRGADITALCKMMEDFSRQQREKQVF